LTAHELPPGHANFVGPAHPNPREVRTSSRSIGPLQDVPAPWKPFAGPTIPCSPASPQAQACLMATESEALRWLPPSMDVEPNWLDDDQLGRRRSAAQVVADITVDLSWPSPVPPRRLAGTRPAAAPCKCSNDLPDLFLRDEPVLLSAWAGRRQSAGGTGRLALADQLLRAGRCRGMTVVGHDEALRGGGGSGKLDDEAD